MKILAIILLLIASFSASAETPPANAFRGNAHGYELAIYLNQIFNDQYGIRAIYFSDGEWIYLSEPVCYTSEIQDKDGADYCFMNAVEEINQAIEDKLLPVSTEPSAGVMRIQWLIENKLKIEQDRLVFVQ